jgi:large subunit ribosomal protein L6
MSRVAKNPITVPQGVDVNINDDQVTVKGPKGNLAMNVHPSIRFAMEDGQYTVKWDDAKSVAMAGTFRALLNNMITGVSEGFEKKLTLVGVGYRAQSQGQKLTLQLGFSHDVNYEVPAGVSVETPSQTEIVIKGCDKQQVGQVAAEVRSFRPPEPYKGKGVRYSDERVIRKEAKKA